MKKKELIDNIISNYIISGRINNYEDNLKKQLVKFKITKLNEMFINSINDVVNKIKL